MTEEKDKLFNKTSFLVNSEVPQFVREDHPTFVEFLEKYYEALERDGEVLYVAKKLSEFLNIDLIKEDINHDDLDSHREDETYHIFLQKMYDMYISEFPDKTIADKNIIVKNVKDFYRARGTEKSVRFIARILFNKEIDFYYPKKDVLRASDGKWFVEKSLKISDITVNNVANSEAYSEFIGHRIYGSSTNAYATVETVDVYYQDGTLITELKLTNQYKTFSPEESIFCYFEQEGETKLLNAGIYGSGNIIKLDIQNPGSGYVTGDYVPVISQNTPNVNAIIKIARTSLGEVGSIGVINSGAGFKINDPITSFPAAGDSGVGASGIVALVNSDGSVHPNTYNIIGTLILSEANTRIGNSSPYESYAYQNLAIQFITFSSNTSNLTLSTGLSTQIELSSWTGNSNVSIVNQTPISFNDQWSIITSSNTTNSMIFLYPGISGNVMGASVNVSTNSIFSNSITNVGSGNVVNTISLLYFDLYSNASNLTASTPVFPGGNSNIVVLSDLPINSNVVFSSNRYIKIGNQIANVTTYSEISNSLIIDPPIKSNILANTLYILEPVWYDQYAANSNVAISNGSIILLSNGVYSGYHYVTNVNSSIPVISITPGAPGNTINAKINLVNKSIVNTSNLKVKTQYSAVTLSDNASNSNVSFTVGDSLQIGNNVVTITYYSPTSKSINVSPELYGNIIANTVIVRRAATNAYSNLTLSTGSGATVSYINLSDIKANSNVFFETFDSIIVGGNTTLVISTNTQTNTIIVNPGITGDLTANSFQIVKRANANTRIADAMFYWKYANTGPVTVCSVVNRGSGYIKIPTLDITANSIITNLGILGRMEIVDGGIGYRVNDKITFTNITGGLGTGAFANVTNVSANGAISEVKWEAIPGFLPGGFGYDRFHLPIAKVVSQNVNAYGANIVATCILGDGEVLQGLTDSIGKILQVTIVNPGSGYNTAPILDLTGLGDGKANIIATIATGVYQYPGRWLNDDGQISAYNFLQNRDYYQNFSYVVRITESLNKYREALKTLTHPAGTMLFGEYLVIDNNMAVSPPVMIENDLQNLTFKLCTYRANQVGLIATSQFSSNLTFSTGSGNTVNVVNLSAWVQNSNVFFENTSSYYMNVKNTLVKIVNLNQQSNVVYVTPAVAGNITANTVRIVRLANVANVVVNKTAHGYLPGSNVYLKFKDGGANNSNGLYKIQTKNTNAFFVYVNNISANAKGNVYVASA